MNIETKALLEYLFQANLFYKLGNYYKTIFQAHHVSPPPAGSEDCWSCALDGAYQPQTEMGSVLKVYALKIVKEC